MASCASYPDPAPFLLALAVVVPGSVVLGAGCGTLPVVEEATGGTAVGTGGSNRSMIFLVPTAEGPLVIDLGWSGGDAALVDGLARRGWRPGEVAGVLLTHAHRDHIAGWRVVAHAPFYLTAAEAPLLLGSESPPGPLDRLAADLLPADRPRPGELELRTFGADTALVFGTDTVRAYPVPGHTRGSAAYLVRGVLFVGDAAGSKRLAGLGPPAGAYSWDGAAGVANLRAVLERMASLGVRYVCTAHARCVTFERAVDSDPDPVERR